ncbi:MAG: sigma-70 family RNA polymerase sigma factor [Lentisphaerae bacterium]|jgi:RNA polymerase sigma-70 factor, ECF subfamily|nr:sigma-70 family RNA polymerase sigma factor [Lentisphaerota bacterium]MBT5611218.1 sigma-70 family RNA polymerase sigma factor [Lentisphaerota bacterium]MBT7059161.1 sigma-70 family RNA polymerase sigma factor [Lentisphaerota bacterium]MBT7842925.1 sigma-70 family RNA polymerase sigma factor [Lentisphaerota bacterium]
MADAGNRTDGDPNQPPLQGACPEATEAHTLLGECIGSHRERLLRLIGFRMHSQLRGRVDAEDVLQDAYLAAEKRLRHYEAASPSVSLFVWVRSVVLQTLTDVHRHHLGVQKRDPRREIALQGQPQAQATSVSIVLQLEGDLTSPSQAAARADVHAVAVRAIEQMDDTDREVLALRHFEELTNKEVAEVLGIEQKAASIRYMRALKRLKALLTDVSEFRERMANG